MVRKSVQGFHLLFSTKNKFKIKKKDCPTRPDRVPPILKFYPAHRCDQQNQPLPTI
ncbi:hypothetical protein Phi46:1_gp48 [Cellulophaga phage phi46:1]|uniref:hypothetical protein n=1 Tax=Cellulophaga phage phi46:1 TaxID=1327974 RepID=UPI000351796B|nr:hypothetical protein Phi46:1_gp48 [Cellulophaga phage phi46:1]AGO47859.1 hypothetical protein Phi46:1_gp48 [Cellulophaga phage phi46:1]